MAKQFGQCGVAGRRVDLPYPGLVANATLDAAIVSSMLKEWIKHEFGVFEETGFVGDRLYPLTYAEGEQELENRGCNETVSQSQAFLSNALDRHSSLFFSVGRPLST